MTSKAESEPSWGTQSRVAASERWKEKSAAMGQPATDALVEYAQPQPGMQVLDLASGTGEPAITLARRIGPQGQVTATDLSADLLAIAETRARAHGLNNVITPGLMPMNYHSPITASIWRRRGLASCFSAISSALCAS
jgi:cyclopropane fatty-acyl-phospholipid synthase-like methyltransferase